MCGIAGVLARANRTGMDLREPLERVSEAQRVRGPDAAGMWMSRDGCLGFAHRRLSIIDLDTRSDQPMRSADGRYTIVFNGEIYNYQEVRRELEGRGRTFRTSGDTEVLLQMYAEHGPGMLNRLRGMYAFAIWDEKEARLFLARDPLGIKPLYYAEAAGRFWFASQVKALLRAPDVDTREEAAGHTGFFVWGSVPEPWTLYRGIRCLPSGSWMTAEPERMSEPQMFASPAAEMAQVDQDPQPKSREETYARLHDALEESVRMHEIADVPVAIFLSAGCDSGLLTSLASERNPNLKTITLGFDRLKGTANDETALACKVAQQYGVEQHTHWIDQQIFLSHRERLLEQMDQPTIDGVNTYFVSWVAREHGFKVALSGLGGDELFGGYPSFEQIPKTVRALRPAQAVPWAGRALRKASAPIVSRLSSPKYASLMEYGGSWGGAYLLRRALFMPWELPEFLDAELARKGWEDLGSVEEMNAVAEAAARGSEGPGADFLRVSALELTYFMRSQLLRDSDWAGMSHSLEIRVPLVDMALLRQLRPLRASRFFPHKPEVMDCLTRPLPPEVRNRPKSGFSIPVREWMQDTPDRGLRHWAKFVYRTLLERGAATVSA